jgi:DNA modification methylase
MARLGFGGPGDPADRLICGDNLPVLEATADGSIDLIYVDPPFATGAVRRGRTASYRDHDDDPEAFVAWLAPRLAHCRRTLADHGSLFLHLDYRAVHYAKVALDRLFGRERLVNEIIWCYSVGGKGRRGFGRKHDTILWYARGADHAFFADAVRVPRKPGSHMRVVTGDDGAPVQEKTDRRTGKVYRYPLAAGKVPEDWWTDIETLNRGDAERTGWPTQKPLRLLERILCAASAPGALVADWFCGSGTTAVAAQRLGRRFVAVDASADAVACAAARLQRSGAALGARDLVVDYLPNSSRNDPPRPASAPPAPASALFRP